MLLTQYIIVKVLLMVKYLMNDKKIQITDKYLILQWINDLVKNYIPVTFKNKLKLKKKVIPYGNKILIKNLSIYLVKKKPYEIINMFNESFWMV